jgi:hypothetical protein
MANDRISIRVTGSTKGVTADLVEPDDDRYVAGTTSKEFEDGSELVYEGTLIQKDVFSGDVAEFTLRTAQNISIGLIANYLYDQLTDSDVDLEIGTKEVPVDPNEIQTTLDEFID